MFKDNFMEQKWYIRMCAHLRGASCPLVQQSLAVSAQFDQPDVLGLSMALRISLGAVNL